MQDDDKVTYWEYLQLEKLLQLQNGLEQSDELVSEDELHFIIVHQVFELWFKLAIREIDLASSKMGAPKVDEDQIPYVVQHLNRINTIIKIAGDHFFLMETLTPQDFLVFRNKLGTASGFQSYQMREMEIKLGLDLNERIKQGNSDPITYIKDTAKGNNFGLKIINLLKKANATKSLRQCIHDWMYRTPIHGSSPENTDDNAVISKFISDYIDAMKRQNEYQLNKFIEDGVEIEPIKKQFEKAISDAADFLNAMDIEIPKKRNFAKRVRTGALFIESYRELPLLSWPRKLLDAIVELEENFVTFRFRHARMVERIIGRRVGTGGSSGVDYLDRTTHYRIFPELWQVRAILLSKEMVPELQNQEIYEFKQS